MSRWLSIDYGTKRIGIAVGSTDEKIASALTVIPAEPRETAVERILRLAGDYQVQGIVVGWALNMDDSEGPQGKLSRAMAAELAAATELDVRLWDERLTSFAADKELAGKLSRKKKRARHDAVAAAKILQDFLAANGPSSALRPDEANT